MLIRLRIEARYAAMVLTRPPLTPTTAGRERARLGRSMGFCPHLRCQLGTVGNSDRDGTCPRGHCYTKLENGAPTYGACCFADGVFNSGGLLGYYDLLRSTPKPIYKRNRVVLGPDPEDESPVR
jgi:hypothetical protein